MVFSYENKSNPHFSCSITGKRIRCSMNHLSKKKRYKVEINK